MNIMLVCKFHVSIAEPSLTPLARTARLWILGGMDSYYTQGMLQI